MKQLVLNIEENRYWQFLQFIQTLDYVKVKEQTQVNISEAHNPKKIDYFADLVSLNAPKVEHLERTSLYNETL
jgi:hypothetical protein